MAEPTEREWLEGLRLEDRDVMAETVLDTLSATNDRNSVDEFSRISIRCDDLRALLAVARVADKYVDIDPLMAEALAPLLRPADPR